MGKTRLEAFSDGVIAILITIMVLELKVPIVGGLPALIPLWPVFLSYVLSYIYLGIYWNNHHHLMHAVKWVNGKTLWANLNLLFWLSLVPFSTEWMGQSHFDTASVVIYGANLFMAAISYFILTRVLLATHGRESMIGKALGNDFKGKISLVLYALGIVLGFVRGWISCGIYILVAIIWLVPDQRIERVVEQEGQHTP